jgi:FAD:protein FMN transferase
MMASTSGTGVVHQEPVMGTVVTFDVVTAAPSSEVKTALGQVVEWLHWVDGTFSTFKPDSEVCRFDRGELELSACSPELRHILALCHRFNRETDGFFDAWAGGSFDPSGVVKGWSIEEASRLLAEAGLVDHLIDGGGDVRLRGTPGPDVPWHVAVRHPLRRDAYCATLTLSEAAVATSGTYERGLHVLNPFSGQPAAELVSATVVGADLTVADAYATGALAMGVQAPAWLDRLTGYEALVIGPDGRGWNTRGWPAP